MALYKLGKSEDSNRKHQKHYQWTHVQRAEIGKHAAEHGDTTIVNCWGRKYPGLKRQTVSDFKLAYLELKKKQDKVEDDVKGIVKKQTGSPRLLPAELMQKVADLVCLLC